MIQNSKGMEKTETAEFPVCTVDCNPKQNHPNLPVYYV